MLEREGVVGEALGERAVVLLGEDRGGHQHQHLLALGGGLEGRAQGHLGLAVADVAADQAVHRPRRLHVGLDQLDRLALVGRLVEREALLELALPVGVGAEGVAAAPAALCVQAEQLAGELLRGAAGARLHRLPARAAELGQRRVLAAGAHVARDLGELIGGHEHAVIALVFEVQVVARDLRHGARLKAREARHAVVLVHDDVPGAQLAEGAQRAAPRARAPAARAALGAAAAQQAVLGEHGELQLRRHEALAQRRGGEAQRGLEHLARDVHLLPQPARFETAEVVGGALALAAAGEGDDGPVARAHEALELGLGLGERARGGVGGLRAQLDRLVGGVRGEPDARALRERRLDAVGAHIQVVGVRVAERGAHIAPVVAEHRRELLLGGDHDLGSLADQIEQRAEALHGQQLGDVGALGVLPLARAEAVRGQLRDRQLGQLAMLGGELGRGRDLDLIDRLPGSAA